MNKENFNFTMDVMKAIRNAFQYAMEKRYEFITIDNLILFISETPKGKEIFEAIGINTAHYKEEVQRYLDENLSKFPKNNVDEKPDTTVAFNNTLRQANILQKVSNNSKADESYILISLFELKKDDCFTLNYFQHYDIKRCDITLYLTHGKKKVGSKIDTKESINKESRVFLDKYATLLNEKAKSGKIDTLIGREYEVNKIIEILAQRKKNNPIITGDAGVGKTAIIEGIAKKIVEGQVPEMFKNYLIYSIDIAALVAGSKYRGDFEDRLKGVLKEAIANPNIVLFIDEIHTLIGAGSSNGTMDASNIMKPALSSGEIKVIGATTEYEYRKYFEKDLALIRRFQKIDILEPDEKQTLEILKNVSGHYEKYHKVKYDISALTEAIKLTGKYINDKKFPDKAIDIIDIAGAKAKINKSKQIITNKHVSKIIAEMLNIPISEIEISDKLKLKNLDSEINKEIFGQEDAITKVVDNIILSRVNLNNKVKPIGSFLFAGPSGVGKTELARQLSKQMNIPLIRFDMSEYMADNMVSKFIGSPPGYVGSEEGGVLINMIRKTPHAILLLDEIEKAHPSILNILLQVMDYGVLTDNHNKKADFQNVIIIMTSNVGAKEIFKNKIGFSKVKDINQDREKEIKNLLSPEFYNRLDSVIQFNALDEYHVEKVVIKQLTALQNNLAEKRIVMIYDNSLVDYIIKNGFDEQMGARPIERYIEKNIGQVLAKEMLFGQLENGGEIKISINENNIQFDYPHIEEIANISITQELEPAKKPNRRKKVLKT